MLCIHCNCADTARCCAHYFQSASKLFPASAAVWLSGVALPSRALTGKRAAYSYVNLLL
jgi:hypothetical protein